MKKIFFPFALMSIFTFSSFSSLEKTQQVGEKPEDIIQPVLVCWNDPEVPSRTCVNYSLTIPYPGNDVIAKPIVIDLN